MTLVKQAINNSLDIWDQCVNHPFIKELFSGTLPEEKFKKYIIEDTIYLKNYAKCFCHGMINCNSFKDIKVNYSMLSFVNETENSTRIKYLKKYGLTDEDIDLITSGESNKKYYEFMLDNSKKGDMLDVMFSTLPCMLSYYYIFKKNSNYEFNDKFIDIINDYTSDRYYEVCMKWEDYTNNLTQNISEERKEKLIDIFRKSSQYELDFWNMCYGI